MSSEQPATLFFYGVLQDGLGPGGQDWPFLKGLGLGAKASVHGSLFAIPDENGWYPALIPTQARLSSVVQGTIHDASGVDIAAIDAFEGPNYTRQPMPVDGWDGYGETHADTYVWTAELPEGAEVIVSGDFKLWLETTGRKPFSG
ncbi:hypothetical protein NAP1_12288 [Erythrobacter sp. NAP1]|uniref:gamma-glutamylcyclotransferase family protein n=1 Tax=Erythrobacter sp. NAP1 TaxID=237727 RepID=UPI00006878B7|nr:gamma-glutamylcyclotransferase family protein [Erythrobacter sp. NAP1]EAQ28375.1 hypothetical protein NAP1_12288 [Erythrobacter sp. NAP1]